MLDKYKTIIFSGGMLTVCLFFSKIVLDWTLNPRFFVLSVFLFLYFIYYFKVDKNDLRIGLSSMLLGLFTIFTILSNFWALNTSLSIVESSKSVLYLFCVFFILNLLNTDEKKAYETLLKMTIILFSAEFFVFILQFLRLEDYSRNSLYSLTGLNGHKNLFSIFIYICLIFSLLSVISLKKIWRIIAFSCIIIQIILIAFLQTRSVWMGVIVFILSFSLILLLKKFISKFSIKNVLISSICTIILFNIFFIYVFPGFLDHLKNNLKKSTDIEKVTDPGTLNERILVWDKTYSFFNEHKILGVGGNNWQIYFPSTSLPAIYPVTDLNVSFQRPHNDFLWILSEYGIIGFNLLLFLIIPVCFFIFRNIIYKKNYRDIIILSGLLGFFCISFFDFPKERIELNILFFIMLSFGIYFSKIDSVSPFINTRINACIISYIPISIILLFIIDISSLNFHGESNMKLLHIERSLGNNKKIINLIDDASSFCYKMDPTTIPLKWYSGNAYVQLNNFEKAKSDFLEAYRLHPYNQYVLNDLGSIYYINRDIDSAIYFYERAAYINPRYDEPILNLIVININQGNFTNAANLEKSLFHESEKRSYYKSIIESHFNK